jgi:hypothetical protein
MARRKLNEKQKESLRKMLARKLKEVPEGPILGLLKEIGKKFRVSAEAVRYYSKDLMEGRAAAPRGRPRKHPASGVGRVATMLRKKAKEHRRLAAALARKHETIARRYEQHADTLAKFEE